MTNLVQDTYDPIRNSYKSIIHEDACEYLALDSVVLARIREHLKSKHQSRRHHSSQAPRAILYIMSTCRRLSHRHSQGVDKSLLGLSYSVDVAAIV